MDRYQKLDVIANGIHAAARLSNIRNTRLSGNTEASSRQNRITTVNEILRILAEYSPDQHRKQLSRIANMSSLYSDVYTNLKNHFNSARNQRMDRDTILKTLDIVKPLADSRGKLIIDKIIKLHDVFYSWP